MDIDKAFGVFQTGIADEDISARIESYERYLKKLIFGILRQPDQTEEAYLEIFQKIYLAYPSWSGENFKAWIARIAVNHCIDRKKDAQKESAQQSLESAETMPVDSSDPLAASVQSPSEIVAANEIK